MKKILSDPFKFFLFLVCPEDSTEKQSGLKKVHLFKANQFAAFNVAEYLGKIKAAFWVITSILIAMALAQLN